MSSAIEPMSELETDWLSLSILQRQAAWMIAQGERYTDIARKLSRKPYTLARWRRMPAFQRVLRALMVFYADEAFNSANVGLTPVIDSLRDIALNGERDSDKIAASKVLLSSWSKLKESLDRDVVSELMDRVAQLQSESAGSDIKGFDEDKIMLELRETSNREIARLAERNDSVD